MANPNCPTPAHRRRGAHLATLLSTVLSILAAGAAASQELITDRPDFTESAVVVPAGTVQVEGGFTWLEVGAVEVTSGPELLVRWGLGRRFELRFGLPDHIDVRRGPSGRGDASIGAKWQLGPTASGWDVALIGAVSLPTGDDEFTSDSSDPELILTLGRDLASGWGLGTQVGVARVGEGPAEDVVTATLVLGTGLGRRTGTFFELAVEDGFGETAILGHHGYTFQPRPNLQLDLHVGAGLSDDAPDTLVGAGLSWRSR